MKLSGNKEENDLSFPRGNTLIFVKIVRMIPIDFKKNCAILWYKMIDLYLYP